MIQFPVTSAAIVAVVASILSLVFTYFPIVRVWWAKQPTDLKSAITILLVCGTAVAIYFLGCWSILVTDISCDNQGIAKLVILLFVSLTSNQGVWTITKNLPQFQDVIDAKPKNV
jgi:hypothetical protein